MRFAPKFNGKSDILTSADHQVKGLVAAFRSRSDARYRQYLVPMLVEIVGTNLPGRRCGPSPDGESYDGVHVGLGINRYPVELVPGDATSARWRIEVGTSRLAMARWTSVGRTCMASPGIASCT